MRPSHSRPHYALHSVCPSVCPSVYPVHVKVRMPWVLRMELRRGAHLPLPRPVTESVGGYTTESVTHGHRASPPFVGTNLYCLVNRGTCVWTTCPGSFVKRSDRESNLTTCWSQVRCPNHDASTPCLSLLQERNAAGNIPRDTSNRAVQVWVIQSTVDCTRLREMCTQNGW